MKFTRVLGTGLLSALMLASLHGTAGAQRRRRVACEEGQHVSGGHCCDLPGEEWVEARGACVCLDPTGCRRPTPPAGGNTAQGGAPANPPAGGGTTAQGGGSTAATTTTTTTTTAATPVATPAPAQPEQQYTCPDGMVLVRGQTFMVGSAPGAGEADETPAHRVTLSPYCIDRTEVTVAQYRQCMQGGACSLHTTVSMPGLSAQDAQFYSQYCNGAQTTRDNHPINCVDWSQADAFCRSRNGRLPTESEWELAARGADQRAYPWGEQAPTRMHLNACDADCLSLLERPGRPRGRAIHDSTDGFQSTAPVGTFSAGNSLFGLQDMAGNVAEWVADWYGPYSAMPATDPTGPASGPGRIVRGGHWLSREPANVRGADRVMTPPTSRAATVGFRCVVAPTVVAPPPPPPPEAAPDAGTDNGGGRRRRRHRGEE